MASTEHAQQHWLMKFSPDCTTISDLNILAMSVLTIQRIYVRCGSRKNRQSVSKYLSVPSVRVLLHMNRSTDLQPNRSNITTPHLFIRININSRTHYTPLNLERSGGRRLSRINEGQAPNKKRIARRSELDPVFLLGPSLSTPAFLTHSVDVWTDLPSLAHRKATFSYGLRLERSA